MGMSCTEIDLDKINYPDGCDRPKLLDIEWLMNQCQRKKYFFNILCVGKVFTIVYYSYTAM